MHQGWSERTSHCLCGVWNAFLLGVLVVSSSLSQSAASQAALLASDQAAPHAAARKLLIARCSECHSADAAESGLRLDSRDGLLKGGEFGPVVVLGRGAASELIRRVRSTGDERMPPDGDQLSSEEIESLVRWIDAEAPWPGSDDAEMAAARDERLDHWAWQPVHLPPVPKTVSAFERLAGVEPARNDIDHFIRGSLSEEGLTPSPAADRRSLIRRLSFDLTGLPPSPAEIDAFIADTGPDAYEKLVDHLLASPRYGERWARHWLDVVHYGDTHGYDKDKPRPNAWPYRDYVIRSLNADKPYARFVEEQIAGDVLYGDTRDGHEAIGFIAAGPWDFIGHREVPETKTDGKIARHLDRDDMVANTIGTFASVTVHCAQCHAHKFDPVSQEDYYSLQAVFAAIDRDDHRFDADPSVARQRQELTASRATHAATLASINTAIAKAAGPRLAEIDAAIAALPESDANPVNKESSSDTSGERKALSEERAALLAAHTTPEQAASLAAATADIQEAEAAIGSLPPQTSVYAAASLVRNGEPRTIHLLSRGNVLAPTREVRPGSLSLIEGLESRFELPADHAEGDRRAALAHWLTNPENPLIWRSLVNRVWHYHFGRGIVDTPGDLGRMGGEPSHPALLDWLAAEFRDSGGSLKALHRLIVTSATYRQVSTIREDAGAIDADNRLLWRQNRRRLEAEAIRDAVLATAGTLDLTMGGPGWQDFVIEHPEHSPHYRYDLADHADPATWRRGVYRFIVRSQTQPFMTCLDCADPSMRVGRRNEGVSALQALALLNNGFVLVQAERFAQRVQAEAGDSLGAQVTRAFELAIGREPDAVERDALIELAQAHGLANTCRTILNLNEFAYVD
jgi:mono/diheme cytochrome c family protein